MQAHDGPAQAHGELTCAQALGGCMYVGAADGTLRAVAANSAGEDVRLRAQLSTESGAVASSAGHEDAVDEGGRARLLSLAHPLWSVCACTASILSICGVEAVHAGQTDVDAPRVLLACGSTAGELVFFQNDLEVRRFQLEGAVLRICHVRAGEFIVADAFGTLYGVTQYEILWKSRLPSTSSRSDPEAPCFFYPTTAQPVVQALVGVKLLDVDKTLSSYVLVATGDKRLLVTHCGKEFDSVSAQTPITTLMSFAVGEESGSKAADTQEDKVLAAGEAGIIYRLVSTRDATSKTMPDFQFTLEVWAQVSFPIAKLLSVPTPAVTSDSKESQLSWLCLGVDGEVELFCGQERVARWDATIAMNPQDQELSFPVDMAVVHPNTQGAAQQAVGVVFPGRIALLSIPSQ